jgi:hypothetical protein
MTADHVGVPHNPDAKGDFHQPRRWARCEVCGGWLLRVSQLRAIVYPANNPAGGIGERRTEWHHRQRKLRAIGG